ncbi:D-alanyl-D-alanine carboxypeptidase [Exiguobacterium indicum]|uniref:serine-type D-Ala-D-Ala carboxypeptidase n=1 Tax=Exiguobacterium indicum TaxID=296995 RepID=A0A0V8GBB1_9BACL|nr:D-alanyl-D-alanine carboxypeptidase family protein [Exiguobacterium enclense]KSU47446.1 D-alanyl-D-alanine carboxypeptidase [Exiguobacterium enclense]SDD56142.1 D-alanyl-D-alanine carboxypeptidase (penicillin-binding protein 5/6) [Exiguobacterium enclense]
MKRILLLCLSILMLTSFPMTGQAAPLIQAESYILADAVTGKILLQSEADVSLPPASMTKLMTLYLVRRQIELKKLTWDQKIIPSKKVLKLAKTSGITRVPVKPKTYTVREMYNAAFIQSANDAAVMLAETVAGSEATFVEKMNETAKQFGMNDTEYANASGLDAVDATLPGTNLMTATDIALLVIRYIKDYPDVLDVTSKAQMKLDGEVLNNSNKMLAKEKFAYAGMRGMKTGMTDLAGYCFVSVTTRDNMTLVTVVMRTDSDQARFRETKKLLDYGFATFEPLTYYGKGERIKDVLPIKGATVRKLDVVTEGSLYVTVSKRASTREPRFDFSKTTAPVIKQEVVGTVQVADDGIYLPGFETPRVNLYSATAVQLASVPTRLVRAWTAWSKRIEQAIQQSALVNLQGDGVK